MNNLNIVTAFPRFVPHMGQLIQEAVRMVDAIRVATPVAQGVYPLNHAVFANTANEDVVVLIGHDSMPVVRMIMKLDIQRRLWSAEAPLDEYIAQYLDEVRSVLCDPQTK